MRGHLRKRGQHSWELAIELGRDPQTGKRKQQFVSFKGTKREAEVKLADLIHQRDNGTLVKPSRKITLGEFLHQWLEDRRSDLSPRVYERYEGIIRNHMAPALGQIPLSRLRPEHVKSYYTSLLGKGQSPASVDIHHAVIHGVLKSALKLEMVTRNVCDAVEIPKANQKEMDTWNAEEIDVFLQAARKTIYYAPFYTAIYTGLRRGELLGLQWDDIDLELGQIQVRRSLHMLKDGTYVFTPPKTSKSRRMIALPPSLTTMLREHQDKQQLERCLAGMPTPDPNMVFCHIDGRFLRPNSVTRAWATMAKQCGLKPIRLHDSRHSHASLLLKQGVHPKVVQERLGHSSISITLDTYSHVAPGIQRAAAEGFDRLFDGIRNEGVGKS